MNAIPDEYYNWDYSQFKTKSSLQEYIDEIKPHLIGKSINHILINQDIYPTGTYIEGYDILKENEYVDIDLICGPTIIKIGEHTLIFDMHSGSNLYISFDKHFEVLKPDEIFYNEISVLFSKNTIGQKITDIVIEPILEHEARGLFDWFPEDVFSNDMFKTLRFELENGFGFFITETFDNTGIYEGRLK